MEVSEEETPRKVQKRRAGQMSRGGEHRGGANEPGLEDGVANTEVIPRALADRYSVLCKYVYFNLLFRITWKSKTFRTSSTFSISSENNLVTPTDPVFNGMGHSGMFSLVRYNGYYILPWKSSAFYCNSPSKWFHFLNNVAAYNIKGCKIKLSNFSQHTANLTGTIAPRLTITASGTAFKSIISSSAEVGSYTCVASQSDGSALKDHIMTHKDIQGMMSKAARGGIQPFLPMAAQYGMANVNGSINQQRHFNEGDTYRTTFANWDNFATTQMNAPEKLELNVNFPKRNNYVGLSSMGHASTLMYQPTAGTNTFIENSALPQRFTMPKTNAENIISLNGEICEFDAAAGSNYHINICPQNGAPPQFYNNTVSLHHVIVFKISF